MVAIAKIDSGAGLAEIAGDGLAVLVNDRNLNSQVAQYSAAARPLIDVESGRIARIDIAYVEQHLVHGPDRTDDLLLEGARQVGGALTCCVNCLGPLRAKVVERAHPDEERDRSAKRDRGIGSDTFEPKGEPALGRFYVVVWDVKLGAHSLP